MGKRKIGNSGFVLALAVIAIVVGGLFVTGWLSGADGLNTSLSFQDAAGNDVVIPADILNNGVVVDRMTLDAMWKTTLENIEPGTLEVHLEIKFEVSPIPESGGSYNYSELFTHDEYSDAANQDTWYTVGSWYFTTILQNEMSDDWKATGWVLRISPIMMVNATGLDGQPASVEPEVFTSAAYILTLTWNEGGGGNPGVVIINSFGLNYPILE